MASEISMQHFGRIVTVQPTAANFIHGDWSSTFINMMPYCPPGFEILHNIDSVHFRELVRLSDGKLFLRKLLKFLTKTRKIFIT